jgi:hypothetical protein
MNQHLEDAKKAMQPGRSGGQPKPEQILAGMHRAIEAMLKYLEELDQSKAG